MAAELEVIEHPKAENEIIRRALALLNQQLWCWGRDILRPEGNWLLEIGFRRIEPPAERLKSSSVYTLELPNGRSVILRGFGSFYGCSERGGVFLHRYTFPPNYTRLTSLESPPWDVEDLPEWNRPTDSQSNNLAALTLDMIDWIQNYEERIVKDLGLEYRRSILSCWKHAKDPIIPAEEMANAWKMLGDSISKDPGCLIEKQ